ncbi:hypothetical protein K474DRAFT_1680122 [Panus rudis PR-1116 ss-1]|nr:hypothetical protein K474DRAFT_1680122 [Panus rudis PR-1116 ss-1]
MILSSSISLTLIFFPVAFPLMTTLSHVASSRPGISSNTAKSRPKKAIPRESSYHQSYVDGVHCVLHRDTYTKLRTCDLWNMADYPQFDLIYESHILQESATLVHCRTLEVYIPSRDDPIFPDTVHLQGTYWNITVEAEDVFVTVKEVLSRIHRYYCEVAEGREVSLLQDSGGPVPPTPATAPQKYHFRGLASLWSDPRETELCFVLCMSRE